MSARHLVDKLNEIDMLLSQIRGIALAIGHREGEADKGDHDLADALFGIGSLAEHTSTKVGEAFATACSMKREEVTA